jgi:hypothetical protein
VSGWLGYSYNLFKPTSEITSVTIKETCFRITVNYAARKAQAKTTQAKRRTTLSAILSSHV